MNHLYSSLTIMNISLIYIGINFEQLKRIIKERKYKLVFENNKVPLITLSSFVLYCCVVDFKEICGVVPTSIFGEQVEELKILSRYMLVNSQIYEKVCIVYVGYIILLFCTCTISINVYSTNSLGFIQKELEQLSRSL